MTDLLEGVNGEFIHINCNIFPIHAFMYRNRQLLKDEPVEDLKSYVTNIIELVDAGTLNVELFIKYIDSVEELIINEHGIIRISLKGENYESQKDGNTCSN